MMIIDDENTCVCGAYYGGNGHCTNGHVKYSFLIYNCVCGGLFMDPDDSWPSRKHCSKGCGQYIDLGEADVLPDEQKLLAMFPHLVEDIQDVTGSVYECPLAIAILIEKHCMEKENIRRALQRARSNYEVAPDKQPTGIQLGGLQSIDDVEDELRELGF